MRCLYAYVAPNKKEILYIGKSWGVTVRGRWGRDAKSSFWDDLEKERKIKHSRSGALGAPDISSCRGDTPDIPACHNNLP